jgi:hypothetical protein
MPENLTMRRSESASSLLKNQPICLCQHQLIAQIPMPQIPTTTQSVEALIFLRMKKSSRTGE